MKQSVDNPYETTNGGVQYLVTALDFSCDGSVSSDLGVYAILNTIAVVSASSASAFSQLQLVATVVDTAGVSVTSLRVIPAAICSLTWILLPQLIRRIFRYFIELSLSTKGFLNRDIKLRIQSNDVKGLLSFHQGQKKLKNCSALYCSHGHLLSVVML